METSAPPLPISTRRSAATARRIVVEVLICGTEDRGDEAAPTAAAVLLADRIADDVVLRSVGQLAIDDLLAVPPGASVVVVDSAAGVRPGQIIQLPLTGLIGRTDDLRPRSAKALSFAEVVGVAGLIRGRPLKGRIVAIGGNAFGPGETLSWPVRNAMPALVAAVVEAIEGQRDRGRPA